MEDENKNVCPGQCNGPRGDETPISCYSAKEEYGICIKHGMMTTNGELRFRLNCKDGSAYIRTQTNDESGWQKAHYHKQLRETYIVERGWIGYIEIADGRVRTKKYATGDLFTTISNVAHNIYMPSISIIHTVKHGAGESIGQGKSDWFDDNEDCQRLTSIIGSSSPNDVLQKYEEMGPDLETRYG